MANEAMRRQWNEASGPEWVALEHQFERMLLPIGTELVRRAAAAPGEHVLDVGCGFGTTTLQVAAAVGATGRVMGLDISDPLLERARQRAHVAGVGNVIWHEADAQEARLPAAHFDLVVSRFGVMFFDDPVAAFTNIARAAKPGARLRFACWQGRDANPWYTFPSQTLAAHIELPALPFASGPGPFAFADPDHVRHVLAAAGFDDVTLDSFTPSISVGTDGTTDGALGFLLRGPIGDTLQAAPDVVRQAGTAALHAGLADRIEQGEVRFPAAVWMVSATRSGA